MFATVKRSLRPKHTTLILDRWALGSQEDSEAEAERHLGRGRGGAGGGGQHGGGGGEEQFKNMMQSFGASPRGNKRFKLGQRRTTHTYQTAEFSHTRKQPRLGRQEDDLDEKLLQAD